MAAGKAGVCVVTGATSGIGLATARALAQQGAAVVVVSRSEARCAAVAEELRRATGNQNVGHLAADLSSLAEVRRVAGDLRQRYPRIRVLVNNAGASLARRRESADGFEYMMALNFLAPFLLTNLLVEPLAAAAPSRVVNVSSSLYKQAKLNPGDLQSKGSFSAMTVYANTKLALILFTLEAARRLRGRGIAVNALGPGLVRTNIGMDEGGMFAFGKRLADFFGGKPPEKGADTVVWLASAAEVEGVTGRYFEDRKEAPLAKSALDPELGRRIWQAGEELTGPVPASG